MGIDYDYEKILKQAAEDYRKKKLEEVAEQEKYVVKVDRSSDNFWKNLTPEQKWQFEEEFAKECNSEQFKEGYIRSNSQIRADLVKKWKESAE